MKQGATQLRACAGNDVSMCKSWAQFAPPPPIPVTFQPHGGGGSVSSSLLKGHCVTHSAHAIFWRKKLKVCSSLWFPSLFIFALSSPVGYVVLVDLLQIKRTLSSTRRNKLLSSSHIRENSLEDTSRLLGAWQMLSCWETLQLSGVLG